MRQNIIPALVPSADGHQFVFYGDACSGVPGTPHEATHARMNQVIARLDPAPEFIISAGDEIIGLTADEAELRAQWRHWRDREMAWLDPATPVYLSTGNHTTYDRMSERVFADVMEHLPRNGPVGQEGLSYFVRRDDLLLVFVHTLWLGLGGEGHVETEWLDATLGQHADARWKFVIGHHPVFPVNGYAGPYQRTIGEEYVEPFWCILTKHGVLAYLCSHILAFDVQCRAGVLQITSAGSGTAHRMPEGIEYLHAVQMAVDEAGLRYQVLDDTGEVREWLSWPPAEPSGAAALEHGAQSLPLPCGGSAVDRLGLRLAGIATAAGSGARQTIFAARGAASGATPLWIGLIGRDLRLAVILQPTPGRSPHYWFGPTLDEGAAFEIEVMLNRDMGPGGILWRSQDMRCWTGFSGASAWGVERLVWPETCLVGTSSEDGSEYPFRGSGLEVVLMSDAV